MDRKAVTPHAQALEVAEDYKKAWRAKHQESATVNKPLPGAASSQALAHQENPAARRCQHATDDEP
eukprot:5035359-Karenia_brevis.AAC.1